jgi:hypothetical protein
MFAKDGPDGPLRRSGDVIRAPKKSARLSLEAADHAPHGVRGVCMTKTKGDE